MNDKLPPVKHSETVFTGKVIKIQRDDLLRENGKEMHREIIIHPDCVCGVALTHDNRIVLVRQYRHPARAYIWELPAGKIDPGENPEEAFRRELIEECGMGYKNVEELVSFYTSPGILTERMHLFLATGCTEDAGDQNPGEIAEWKTVSLEEAEAMIGRGDIADAKSIIGISYARKRQAAG